MRLHYLHLPRYGPLRDLRCVFRQNTLLPGRRGAVNFVVGVNGTGKSSLLRALYHIFRCLEDEEPPPFPVSLAYSVFYKFPGDSRPTLLLATFDCPGDGRSRALLQVSTLLVPPVHFTLLRRVEPQMPTQSDFSSFSFEEWAAAFAVMRESRVFDIEFKTRWVETVPGDKWIGSTVVRSVQPSRLLAYTSGDSQPWVQMRELEFRMTELEPAWADPAANREERPRGWTPREERPHALREMVTEEVAGLLEQLGAGREATEEERKRAGDLAKRLRAQVRAATNQHLPYQTPKCTLLGAGDLHLAAVALGVWNAAVEFRDRETETARAAFLKTLRTAPEKREGPAAKLFNHLNWAWPTHLTLFVNPGAEPPDDENIAKIFSLHGLSCTVLRQPLGRRQLVIPLGPRGDAVSIQRLVELVESKHKQIANFAEQMDACATGAEAVARLFDAASAPWRLFEALKAWRESGWLERATLTVLRTAPLLHDGESDNVVLCLEDFSDGERELLGRIALLFLLKGQTNSLLLLDEPETHFNDAWKREVVDFVDDQLLKTTPCQVLVSTHSSVAVTDLFPEEITILRQPRPDSKTQSVVAVNTTFPTFGSDPSRILRHVFDAPDSIGARSREALDHWLASDWTGREEELARFGRRNRRRLPSGAAGGTAGETACFTKSRIT